MRLKINEASPDPAVLFSMRKLLLLAPTFYPHPHVSAIRVSQWARHLPEFGWQPLVLCRHHGFTATREGLDEAIHPEVQVEYLGPHAPPPRTAATRMNLKKQLNQLIFDKLIDPLSVPDSFVWKWRRLSNRAIAIAEQWKPDVVMSSSPPHSIHLVGREVAQATGVPWVADFRDPYLIDRRFDLRGLKKLFAKQHREFERGIYRDAALCIHAIPIHGRWAAQHYPFARDTIRILPNGIPSELLDEHFLHAGMRSSRLSIRGVGYFGRGAVAIMASVLRSLEQRGIEAELRHAGRVVDAPVSVPPDLKDRLQFLGRVDHQRALREIVGADVLLKFDDLERAKVNGLSSKLFEYLATGKPIVAINLTRPDRQLLRRIPWCWCLENPRPDAIVDAVEQAVATKAKPCEEWLRAFRQQYNRRNQTQRLACWLEELVR